VLEGSFGKDCDGSDEGRDDYSLASLSNASESSHQQLQNQPNNDGTDDGKPSAANKLIFKTFIALNFVTFLDRAIIPGASSSFAAFVAGASDASPNMSNHPDMGIGMLQASFIVGYSVAMVFCGHLVHTVPWKTLTVVGLLCWMGAVTLSGLSYYTNSFYLLVFSRMTSGIAEAAFQIVAPPLILDRGGHEAGKWLGCYLTATPVGVATGFVYGSAMATTVGWQWAYFCLVFASLPLLYMCRRLQGTYQNDGGILAVVPHHGRHVATDETTKNIKTGETADLADLEKEDDTKTKGIQPPPLSSGPRFCCGKLKSMTPPCFKGKRGEKFRQMLSDVGDEIWACMSSDILLCIILAYAAYVAVLSTLGTFGGAFILGLELFDNELTGAIWFGLAAATAGMIGTPLGGRFVDRLQEQHAGESDIKLLAVLTKYISLGVLAGACVAWPSVFCTSPATFLFFVFGGWCFLFSVQTAIMECIMLSVAKAHRPNAIASSTLLCHALGDVPAPIIFGAIKDYVSA
jgi:MFS family permease